MAADTKTKKSGESLLGLIELVALFVILSVLAGIVVTWWHAHKSVWSTIFSTSTFYLINFFAKYAVFAFLFSIAMIILVVLYSRRYNALREKVIAKILPTGGFAESNEGNARAQNPKWQLVQDHLASNDAGKWKFAILEADIILADLLNTLNLPGDGVGEKLKAVNKNDFTALDAAWEAHKIRNAIAHEGSDFLVSEREAKRVIGLYQKVFEEFEII